MSLDAYKADVRSSVLRQHLLKYESRLWYIEVLHMSIGYGCTAQSAQHMPGACAQLQMVVCWRIQSSAGSCGGARKASIMIHGRDRTFTISLRCTQMSIMRRH